MFAFDITHLIDCVVLLVLYICVFYPKWKQKDRWSFFVRTTMYIYLSFVLFYTMMPVITSLPYWFDSPREANMIPFLDYKKGYGGAVKQIILNVIMTVPFGILFPLTQKESRRNFIFTVFVTFGLSLTIEILQPIITLDRTFDITDLITNTCGGAIGFICFSVVGFVISIVHKLTRHNMSCS